jgi:hypothetical protein
MVQFYTTEIQLYIMICCKITGELDTKKAAQLLSMTIFILQIVGSEDWKIKGKFVAVSWVLKECPSKMLGSFIGVVQPEKLSIGVQRTMKKNHQRTGMTSGIATDGEAPNTGHTGRFWKLLEIISDCLKTVW